MQSYSKFIEKKEKLEEQIKIKEKELSNQRFKAIQSSGVQSLIIISIIGFIILLSLIFLL
ncbi:MAG: hypothetical protein CML12_01105 [Puniceicoccaceae bacterium]|nr:hypothetical protein [Puniceicoccaceae bacterium]